MRRYLLFAGSSYYPEGGTNDLVADSDNFMSLRDYAIEREKGMTFDWWEILDTVLGNTWHQRSKKWGQLEKGFCSLS